jgi:hypothetical protein
MSNTSRNNIPYIVSGQSQKEVTHNEDMNIIDMLLQSSVKGIVSSLPTNPSNGDMYINGNSIYCYIQTFWKSINAQAGYTVYNQQTGRLIVFNGSTWVQYDDRNYGTAIPKTGTWKVGDKIYNSAPAASGYIGWVCVGAGTPGTWLGFGQIAAS